MWSNSFLLVALPAIFTIVNPLGAVGPFLAMTARDSTEKKSSTAQRACTISAIVLLACAAVGTFMFNFFGFTLPALKIAGGLLLGWIGALIAVPAAAVVQVIVEDVLIPWRRRQLAAAEAAADPPMSSS